MLKAWFESPHFPTTSLLVAALLSGTAFAQEAPAIPRPDPAVAEFALLLENSKFKGDASFDDVLKRARGAKGKDDEGYRAEFIRLVEAAQLFLKI